MTPSYLARLASIDGATVITSSGDLVAYGSIIQSPQGGGQGARSAAAEALSLQSSVALKVSEDGPITVFVNGSKLATILEP